MKNNPILKRLYHAGMLCILLCASTGMHAQSLIKGMEYFLDDDPGIGRAKFVSVMEGADIKADIAVPVSDRGIGLHVIGMRVYNGQRWSSTYTKCFIIPFPETEWVLSHAEYFWDTDPGVGLATAFDNVPSGSSAIMEFQLPDADLSEGLHTLGVRVQANEVWSSTYTKQVLVVKPGQEKPIVAAEYFWDTDPGMGKATALTNLSAGSEVIADVSLAADTLTAGLHTLGVRCHNGERWTSTYIKQVYVAGGKHLVDALEYFWDTDPSYGNGTLIPCTPAEVVEFDLGEVTMPDASMGSHRLYIRARSGDTWSQTFIKDYCINANPDFSFPSDTVCMNERIIVSNLTTEATEATTYAWDMDGDGKIDGTSADDFVYSYTKSGEFTASLAVKTVGDCETVCYKKIVVLSTDNPSVKLRVNNSSSRSLTICEGDVVTFSALPYNAGATPEFEWILNDEVIASGKKDTLQLDSLKNNDIVKVRVVTSNPCCAIEDAVSNTVRLYVNAVTEASLPQYLPVYTTEKSFILEGGMPEGGVYYVDGKEAMLFNPAKNTPGTYRITYRYTNASGCTSEVNRTLELKDGSLQLGDVNKDGTVDEADMDCLSRVIYGETNLTYNRQVADLDKNGEESVADIIGIAGIILGQYEQMPDGYAGSAVLSMVDTSGEPGETVPLKFTIQGDEKVCGMQFDITVPDGVILHSESSAIRLGQAPESDTNVYRLLTYSPTLEALPATVSLLAEIPSDMEERDYPVTLNGITLSDAKMRNVLASSSAGVLHVHKATGIDTNEADMYVYSEREGIRVLRAEDAVCSVTDTSGRLILKEKLHTNSQYIPLQVVPGIYLVELQKDNQRVLLKLVIK